MIYLWLLATVVSALFSALFSGMEMGVYVYDQSKQNLKKTGKLIKLLGKRESLIIACLVGTNIAVYMTTYAFGQSLSAMGLPFSWLHPLEIFLLTPCLFLVGEIIPKSLFQSRANFLLPKITWLLAFSMFVLWPFVILMNFLSKLLNVLTKSKRGGLILTRKRLHWLLEDQEGGLSEDQSMMITNVLLLKDRRISSIMEPCKKVSRVSVTAPLQKIKQKFFDSDRSFFIVYDKKPEHIMGIVFMNQVLLSENSMNVKSLLVEIPVLTHKSTLTSALDILRSKSSPVGQVVGANGHTLGLVFTRRIVQEIVGELQIW